MTASLNIDRLDAALHYLGAGYPVTYCRGKAPNVMGRAWHRQKVTPDMLRMAFHREQNLNIGIRLGPAGGLIDVESDSDEEERLFAQLFDGAEIPVTPTFKSRRGKHRLFKFSTALEKTGKAVVNFGGKLGVRIGANGRGAHSCVPPSINEDGTTREWLPGLSLDDVPPAELPPVVVARLLAAANPQPSNGSGARNAKPSGNGQAGSKTIAPHRAALAAMLRMRTKDSADGSKRLFAAACRCVEFDLGDYEAVATIREYARRKPFPKSVHYGIHDVLKRLRDAEQRTERGKKKSEPKGDATADRDGATIYVHGPRGPIIDQAIAVLGNQDNVFQRSGAICHVVTGAKPPRGINRPPESPAVVSMAAPRITELLTDSAVWLKEGKDGDEFASMPKWLPSAIEARGQWDCIPRIEGIVESPVLRADGSILSAPGYDAATGLLFRPRREFPPVPSKPTLDDAIRARDELLEVVADFPFSWPDGRPAIGIELSENPYAAVWLASVLTLLARYAYDGPTPLFLVEANRAGTGKGLLADSVAQIVYGRNAVVSTLPRNDEEWRKRVTALARAGDPMILLDNVAGQLGSPVLDAVLTATIWKDRLLGVSEMTKDLPLYATWFATANNVAIGGDLVRRIAHVKLEYLGEDPETRSDFRHKRLSAWVAEERPRLATAALMILRAYHVAGRPPQSDVPTWGSYEAWSDLVRQTVVWIGMPDPAATRQQIKQADDKIKKLRMLLDAWQQAVAWDAPHGWTDPPMTVAELVDLATDPHNEPAIGRKDLHAALAEIGGPELKKATRKIGQYLGNTKRVVVDGLYLDLVENSKTNQWRVRSA